MTPVYLAGLWTRPSWGQYQGTGAHPGVHGWERAAAWPEWGEGVWRLQLLLIKSPVTSVALPPPSAPSCPPQPPFPQLQKHRDQCQCSWENKETSALLAFPQQRTEIGQEQKSAQLQIWAGSGPRVPLPPPASQTEGAGPCAVHAHPFLPPSYCPLLKHLPFPPPHSHSSMASLASLPIAQHQLLPFPA